MTIEGVIYDVGLSPNEPFVKRGLAVVEDFVPFLEPFQFFSALAPETGWIFQRILVEILVLFNVRLLYDVGWGIINLLFRGLLLNGCLNHSTLLWIE